MMDQKMQEQMEGAMHAEASAPRDYFGNIITVGAEVAFMQTGYRSLMKGTIKKITDKTVLIAHPATNTCKTETKQAHDQVIVNPNSK